MNHCKNQEESLFELALARGTKRYRPSSVEVYSSMWKGLEARLEAIGTKPGSADIGRLASAIREGGDYSYQRRLFKLVQWVYETLEESGMDIHNPTAELARLYAEEERPEHAIMPRDWADKMRQRAIESVKGWKGLRLCAIVSVLSDTGLRNKELLLLNRESLLGKPPSQIIVGPVRARRKLPISRRTGEDLLRWLEVHPAPQSPLVFVADNSGRAMDPTTVWRQLKRLTAYAIGENMIDQSGTGIIRANVAKSLEAEGMPNDEIARFLGHRQEHSTGELLERVKPRRRSRSKRQKVDLQPSLF